MQALSQNTTVRHAKAQRFVYVLSVSVLSLSMLPASYGQTPADAGSLLRQQEQQEKRAPARLPEVGEEAERPPMIERDGLKVTVKAIRFEGDLGLVPEPQLQALVHEAIGKELDFDGLQALANKITDHLRTAGYMLARAYLPKQDVSAGEIVIVIQKGRLDGDAQKGGGWRVSVQPSTARLDPARLTAMGEAAVPSGSVVKDGGIERALLLMSDLPGVAARARLEPGETSGSTRVVVMADEGPLYSGTAWAENSGNWSTGKSRVNALLNVNDPAGWGDQASLFASASEGVRLGKLGYEMPLGASGAHGELGYTALRYKVVEGTGKSAGLEGQSQVASLGLNYPFIRSRGLNLRAGANLSRKRIVDDSDAGRLHDKRVNVLDLVFSGDRQDFMGGGGVTAWNLELAAGDLDLSALSTDAAADAASLDTAGRYSRLNGQLTRLQRLPDNFSLYGRFAAQWANKNLDSSEEYFLGGPAGVRAYPVGEGAGDEGWLGTLELRYDWPGATAYGAMQFSTFYDTGGITIHDDPGTVVIATATGKNTYSLSGAGLSASLGKAEAYSLRATWAHTIGNNPGRSTSGLNVDNSNDKSRLWLQAVIWF